MQHKDAVIAVHSYAGILLFIKLEGRDSLNLSNMVAQEGCAHSSMWNARILEVCMSSAVLTTDGKSWRGTSQTTCTEAGQQQ
jgi:hypothetical protein